MEEILIEFETAKLAKEKGFDLPHSKYYGAKGSFHNSKQRLTHESLRSGGFLAPTQSLLQKWIREEYNFHIKVEEEGRGKFWYYAIVDFKERHSTHSLRKKASKEDWEFKTHEEALEKGLMEALKLILI